MTKMSLLSAMASAVIARHEAIQWTDNKQIAKHVIGRSEATWQSSAVHHPGLLPASYFAVTIVSITERFLSSILSLHGHRAVFHIVFDTGNQMQPILKKQFIQGSRNISFVSIKFAGQFFAKRLNYRQIPVIHIGGSNAKIEQFTPVIDRQMEFKAIEPPHRAFASGCNIPEDTVPFDPFIFTNSHFSGINKGDACTFAKTNRFQKHGKRNHNFPLKLNKTIVRKQIGKLSTQMFSDIKQINMRVCAHIPLF
jgi:hypothetical protein